jgi:hypothetical protein
MGTTPSMSGTHGSAGNAAAQLGGARLPKSPQLQPEGDDDSSPRAMLGRKARRAVPLPCGVSHPNHTIEQRLGALSGPTSRLAVESFKTLVVCLGLSGASPRVTWTARTLPACPTKLPGAKRQGEVGSLSDRAKSGVFYRSSPN